LINRMKRDEEPKEEGIRIAVETILELKRIEGVRGIHLMPLLWESVIPRIAEEADLKKNGEKEIEPPQESTEDSRISSARN